MSRSPGIYRPIFLVGMGRSGSTVAFESVAAHPQVGWLSHLANRRPTWRWLYVSNRLCDVSLTFRKAIERTDEKRSLLEKFRLGPAEAYETWESICGDKIRYDWLLGARASESERLAAGRLVCDVLRFSGKQRFGAKFTGPPRIGYLASLFPDARFVHLIRDGRAVARSLLRVDFWRGTRRMEEPAWRNGFPEAWDSRWRQCGNPPLALAALQWRRVIEVAREEAALLSSDQYHEVRYEEFVADPHGTMDRILGFVELAPAERVHAFLSSRYELRDMNRAQEDRSATDDRLLDGLIGPTLAMLGYARG